MLSNFFKFNINYLICLLIVFFLYLIIYQLFAYWYEQRTNNKYFGYNAFGFGTTYDYGGFGNITGNLDGLKGFSFLNDGMFSDLFSCKSLIESFKNNLQKMKSNSNYNENINTDSNDNGNSNDNNDNDNNDDGTSNLQNLTKEINDLSNNLYLLSDQVNQMSVQQGILAQQNLPSQPVKVTGADVYNSN